MKTKTKRQHHESQFYNKTEKKTKMKANQQTQRQYKKQNSKFTKFTNKTTYANNENK